jgi:hypothetical protein
MANKYLDDFRTKYPMYKDMNDETLAKNIHQTFYKDINENEYFLLVFHHSYLYT